MIVNIFLIGTVSRICHKEMGYKMSNVCFSDTTSLSSIFVGSKCQIGVEPFETLSYSKGFATKVNKQCCNADSECVSHELSATTIPPHEGISLFAAGSVEEETIGQAFGLATSRRTTKNPITTGA